MYGSQSEIKKGAMILAAAGSGKRMGLAEPKQFLEYQGKALFLQSVFAAEKSSYLHEIIIVCQEEYREEIERLCKEEQVQKVKAVVLGGKERQDSIYAALQRLSEEISYVFVQDAARPFCKEKYFEACYEALEEGYAGAVIGVPVKDTIKLLSQGEIVETPVRAHLFAAHTPQAFPKSLLIRAYEEAKAKNVLGTDDSSLVEAYLGKEKTKKGVKAILGDYDNVKITVFEDLTFLKLSESSQK